jgi:hypothetical protein
VSRFSIAVLIASILLYATACGNVFVRATFGTASTLQGTVNSVQLSTNGNAQVTFVTFLQSGALFTIGFCGDQTSLFPLNRTLTINFNPGQTCATIIAIVIVV